MKELMHANQSITLFDSAVAGRMRSVQEVLGSLGNGLRHRSFQGNNLSPDQITDAGKCRSDFWIMRPT